MAENQQNRNFFKTSSGQVSRSGFVLAPILHCCVKPAGTSPSFPALGNSLTLLKDRLYRGDKLMLLHKLRGWKRVQAL